MTGRVTCEEFEEMANDWYGGSDNSTDNCTDSDDDSWQQNCEFTACDDAGYCWQEICGDMYDECGRYTCTLWNYD